MLEQTTDARCLLARADQRPAVPCRVAAHGRFHDGFDAMQRDELAVEQDPDRIARRAHALLQMRRKEFGFGADEDGRHAIGPQAEAFGEPVRVRARVQHNEPRGTRRQPVPQPGQSGQGISSPQHGAVLDHGFVQGEERIPDDRRTAQAREGPQHQYVEVAEIADKDDIVRCQAQIAP